MQSGKCLPTNPAIWVRFSKWEVICDCGNNKQPGFFKLLWRTKMKNWTRRMQIPTLLIWAKGTCSPSKLFLWWHALSWDGRHILYYATLQQPALATSKDSLGYRPPHRRVSLTSSSKAKDKETPSKGWGPRHRGVINGEDYKMEKKKKKKNLLVFQQTYLLLSRLLVPPILRLEPSFLHLHPSVESQ